MAFESEVVLRCVLTCRRDRRHGKPGGLLHAGAGVASLAGCSTRGGQHWVETRAVGKGGQGRLESRPQARKPAPQKGVPHKRSLHYKNSLAHTRSLLHKSSLDSWTGREKLTSQPPAQGASLEGCSTGGGGVRWSAQSCGPDGV